MDELNQLSKILTEKGQTVVKIRLSDKINYFSFQLKNKRNIDRKMVNILRNKEISTFIR
jgi:DNA polymerase-3 subunit alpha